VRAYLPAYEMIEVATLAEALSRLAAEPGVWKPFAGGTDLMVQFEMGRLAHKKLLSIWNLDELRGIETREHAGRHWLRIGALETYSSLQNHAELQRSFPNLVASSRETGAVAIQNRGTIGGNLANASPAADSSPNLLVYGAEIELDSQRGSRRIPYADFHQGYKKIPLAADELIAAVWLPLRDPSIEIKDTEERHFYRKVGTRKAQAISKVAVAGWARLEKGRLAELRLALASVADRPIRALRSEALLTNAALPLSPALRDQARQALAHDIKPQNDIRSTGAYRLRVAGNLVDDFLGSLA
jgi:CO/xanthine dehydrogenase FAD-binding subunit